MSDIADSTINRSVNTDNTNSNDITDNTDTKPWYLSRGFLGTLSTALLFGLRQAGIVDVDDNAIANLVYTAAEFAGLILGMVGRARADKKLRAY